MRVMVHCCGLVATVHTEDQPEPFQYCTVVPPFGTVKDPGRLVKVGV